MPSKEQLSSQKLRCYAHIYIDTQQRFHGVYADKILIGRGLKLSGKLPYWDIDASATNVNIIGFLEGSPLKTSEGKLRIFCHYLDTRAKNCLRENYGAPSGQMLARMTNSGRTVMVFPHQTSPFMLKFSGDFLAAELGFNHTLEAKNIQQAIVNYAQQTCNPYLTPEPVGIVIPKINFAFLQRNLPAPRDDAIASDDVLLGTQVILSDVFASTKLGKNIFAPMGSQSKWLEKVFAPKIAELIDDSLQRKVAHLELHPQNLDILVNTTTGKIRHLFVKDLEDMYQDPAALVAATGEFPQDLNITRDRVFGILGEYRSQYTLDRFYWEFLGQTLGKEQCAVQDAVADWLREKSLILLRQSEIYHYADYEEFLNELKSYREYNKLLNNQAEDLFDIIATLRDLLLKINLNHNFCPNESARHHLSEDEGTVVSSSRLKAFSFTPCLSHLEFGFIGDVPVAISRDTNGIIKDYYFKFKTV